jgi:hypothetical protein
LGTLIIHKGSILNSTTHNPRKLNMFFNLYFFFRLFYISLESWCISAFRVTVLFLIVYKDAYLRNPLNHFLIAFKSVLLHPKHFRLSYYYRPGAHNFHSSEKRQSIWLHSLKGLPLAITKMYRLHVSSVAFTFKSTYTCRYPKIVSQIIHI